MRLIKIRFTSWRDKSVAPRTSDFQAQLDALTMRERALTTAAARARVEQGEDTGWLRRSLAKINDELQTIDAERTSLLSAEQAAAEAETRAATEHPKVGTYGYQVLDDAASGVALIVDEEGAYLPVQALYTFGLVDENPPLPEWAKDGKFGP